MAREAVLKPKSKAVRTCYERLREVRSRGAENALHLRDAFQSLLSIQENIAYAA